MYNHQTKAAKYKMPQQITEEKNTYMSRSKCLTAKRNFL